VLSVVALISWRRRIILSGPVACDYVAAVGLHSTGTLLLLMLMLMLTRRHWMRSICGVVLHMVVPNVH